MKKIIYVVIILIAVISISYYLINKRDNESRNQVVDIETQSNSDIVANEKTKDSLSDWQTYKSSTYDYEIQYPSEFNLSWNNSPISKDVTGIDTANYVDKNYDFQLQIFARDGFVLDNCLKDLLGKDITKTITANGNDLYVYNDHEKGLGGRMALIKGAIRSEFHTIHNGYCYILVYTITPTDPSSISPKQLSEKVDILDRIISTFKLTK